MVEEEGSFGRRRGQFWKKKRQDLVEEEESFGRIRGIGRIREKFW